jgi:hypothetical protein
MIQRLYPSERKCSTKEARAFLAKALDRFAPLYREVLHIVGIAIGVDLILDSPSLVAFAGNVAA